MVTLSVFDELIASMSLLKHPFYQKWNKGELTLNDLRVYAKEYYHLVTRIPGIVSRVRDRVENRDLKMQIEENIREEQEHVVLWERFSSSLGISVDELQSHKPSLMTQSAVREPAQGAP